VASLFYWSSTANETFPTFAWAPNLILGRVDSSVKASTMRVWPVRGGTPLDTWPLWTLGAAGGAPGPFVRERADRLATVTRP
jgi:hypothetical protein